MSYVHGPLYQWVIAIFPVFISILYDELGYMFIYLRDTVAMHSVTVCFKQMHEVLQLLESYKMKHQLLRGHLIRSLRIKTLISVLWMKSNIKCH